MWKIGGAPEGGKDYSREKQLNNKSDKFSETKEGHSRLAQETNDAHSETGAEFAEEMTVLDLRLGEESYYVRSLADLPGGKQVHAGGIVEWKDGALLEEWATTFSGELTHPGPLARFYQVKDFPGMDEGDYMDIFMNVRVDKSGKEPVSEISFAFRAGHEAFHVYTLRLLLENRGDNSGQKNISALYFDFWKDVVAKEEALRNKPEDEDEGTMLAGK